jgi:wobble nucleotide-excising tRNase
MIYAENGRGKTTLAAILRSLSNGDPRPILERKRLSSAQPPHVIVQLAGGTAIFRDGVWSQQQPDIAVFDDRFVTDNVYSGMSVEAGHRQNLHELIIGAQGVALNDALRGHVSRIEDHNRILALLAEAIPAGTRGPLTVDQFCALQPRENLNVAIQDAERNLAAARSAGAVAHQPAFAAISLPRFDRGALERVLALGLEGLENLATDLLEQHFAELGEGGEVWVQDGMQRVVREPNDPCPFCAQSLAGSPLIQHYRAYFGDAYSRLKRDISDAMALVGLHHNGDAKAAFERAVRIMGERAAFWGQFMEVPDTAIDTARVVRLWNAAHDTIFLHLSQKNAQPLEAMALEQDAGEAIEAYHNACAMLDDLSARLVELEGSILLVKERSAVANLATLAPVHYRGTDIR